MENRVDITTLTKIDISATGEIKRERVIDLADSDAITFYQGKELLGTITIKNPTIEDINDFVGQFRQKRKEHVYHTVLKEGVREFENGISELVSKFLINKKITCQEEVEYSVIEQIIQAINSKYIIEKTKYLFNVSASEPANSKY